jgi:hypothetical protein
MDRIEGLLTLDGPDEQAHDVLSGGEHGLHCGSAWKKDPVGGVIGIQSGPPAGWGSR